MAKQRIIPIIYKVDYKQVDQSTAAVKKAEQATDKLNKEIKQTETVGTKSFMSLKQAIVATGLLSVVGTLSKKIFDLGVAQEQTTIAFNTFLGSAEKGKKLLAELTKFSIITPFTPDQVNKAAKSLLAFGVEANKIIPTLKILGDVSAGTGKDLSEMAIIFGQIRSTGRLMGQDLLQLINAGFNPLQIIAQKTGRSVALLKADMEKGLITFDMVEQAFVSATSKGGLFFNLMEAQSQTVGGRLSTVAGNIEEIGKKAFEANKGGLSEFVDLLVKITGELAKPIEEPIYLSDAQLKNIKELNEMQQKYGTIQPSYWDRLRVAVVEYFTEKNRLTREDLMLQLEMVKANYDAGFRSTENIKKIQELSSALGLIQKGTTEDPLPWATPAKASGIDTVTTATNKLTDAQKKARHEFMMMMGFTTAAEKVRARKDTGEREEGSLPDFSFESEFSSANAMQDLLLASFISYQNRRTEAARKGAEERREIEETAFNFGVDAIGALLLTATDSYNAESEALREKYDNQIRLAGDNERAKEQIEIRRAEEERKLRQKQVEDEKRQNVRRILIETVLNAVKALGLPPIPGANYIAAAKATAYGLLGAVVARRYSKGSEVGIDGAGTHTSDSIPAMLSKGETVMSYEQTQASKGILKAIKARKLNDAMIDKLYKGKVGTDGAVFNDERIVASLNRLKPDDVIKKGSYLYDVKQKNANHVQHVRRKYIH